MAKKRTVTINLDGRVIFPADLKGKRLDDLINGGYTMDSGPLTGVGSSAMIILTEPPEKKPKRPRASFEQFREKAQEKGE